MRKFMKFWLSWNSQSSSIDLIHECTSTASALSCGAGAIDCEHVSHEAAQGGAVRWLQPLHPAPHEQVPGGQGSAAVP